MRKIEKSMLVAIANKKAFKERNTEVFHSLGLTVVSLYGHYIASLTENEVTVSSCGYKTNTTKSRLNAVLGKFGYGISCRSGRWYVGDKEFIDGMVIGFVKEESNGFA